MKSLAWIESENAELIASLRRLKQRLVNAIPWDQPLARRNAMAAVDAWAEAERKRGGR